MALKKVKQLLYGQMVSMDGSPIRQPIPTEKVEQIDPFLLLHHHISHVPTDRHPSDVGVGPHPHRGFSPVTFIFQGNIHHRDSRGNSSIVRAGGAQWLSAGRGIVHSERPAKSMLQEGGAFEVIQLWINLPQRHKMGQPTYQPLQKEDVPTISDQETRTTLQLFAGKQQMLEGPAKTQTGILAVTAEVEQGGRPTFEIPEGWTSFVYLLDGRVNVKGFGIVDAHHLIYLYPEGDTVELEAKEDTRLLLMAGEPINEPIQTYGPFVMNNQTEIMQAMRDYQMGKMGILVEEF